MTTPIIPTQDTDTISDKAAGLLRDNVSRRLFLRRSFIGAAMVAPVSLLAACGQITGQGGNNTPAPAAPTAPPAKAPGLASLQSVANNKSAFSEIMSDEDAHVKFLQSALKGAARPKPTFKGLEQDDIMAFAKVSQVLENTGVGAYLLAAPSISNKAYLAAAGSILTIEARHAGFLDVLMESPISANGAFDKPISQAEIVKAVAPFITNLNGGGDPSAPLKNDGDILNFALLLEFLEAEFYNLNVPKFFK